MPKSIYFTDDRYGQIVEAARKCGYRVSRGRGSQLAQFVVWASNTACSGQGVCACKTHGLEYLKNDVWHCGYCKLPLAAKAQR